MKRRSFLQVLLTAIGAGAAPVSTLEAAPTKRILLQQCPIAGFQYYEGEALWPALEPGDALRLIRNADNPHDQRAVRIIWRGHMLGHLPRRDNATISQLLDRGLPLHAAIESKTADDNPWLRMQIKIWLEV